VSFISIPCCSSFFAPLQKIVIMPEEPSTRVLLRSNAQMAGSLESPGWAKHVGVHAAVPQEKEKFHLKALNRRQVPCLETVNFRFLATSLASFGG
jgi:hypothetical protein